MTAKLVRALAFLLTPLWVTTFRDPVQSGRLRLDGLSRTERLLARCGLVLLVLLLLSLLFTEAWRRRELLALDIDELVLVPDGLLPVTLVAVAVGASLVVWGALGASPVVRVLVALLYVTSLAPLGVMAVAPIGESWLFTHGETVLQVCFWTPAAALVLSALLSLVRAHRWVPLRWTTLLLRVVSLVALLALGVTHLRVHVEATEAGLRPAVTTLTHQSFTSISSLLLPLTLIAAVAVVDFATDVSTSLAEPVRTAPAQHTRLLAVGLVVLALAKLWSAVWRQRDYWSTLVTYEPSTIVRTLLTVAGLVALVLVLWRRVPPGSSDELVDVTKERLTFASSVVLTLGLLVQIVLFGLGQLVFNQTGNDGVNRFVIEDFPTTELIDWAALPIAVVALAMGVHLLRRPSRPGREARDRELGTGLVVLGAWSVPAWIITNVDRAAGFSFQVVDLVVTLGVLAWLLVRWRRIDNRQLALLLAVVVFSWLVISRGDYISFAGGLLGLPAIVVVVFGIAYTMASGAAVTTESSARLPREARTLMFTGYLLLSVAVLNWLEVTQASSYDQFANYAAYFLALPLAAWLLIRRIIPRELAAGGSGRG